MLSATTAQLNRNAAFFDWYMMPEAFSAPLVDAAMNEFGVAPGETVFDPFSGTGTTLVAAQLANRNGFGVEVNPFLAFAARVKTENNHQLPLLQRDAARVLAASSAIIREIDLGRSGRLAERLPEMPRLERWISRRVALKVMAIREAIGESVDESRRGVPLLALASILRGVSNMKLSPHAFGSREVRHDAPVLHLFESKLARTLADIESASRYGALGSARVVEGDIRELSHLTDPLLPASLAITSPPYLNNLDYTMQTRMELFFLGFVLNMDDLKRLRKKMMICDAKATYRDVLDWRRSKDIASVAEVAAHIDEALSAKNWGWDYGLMTRQYFGGLLRAIEAVRTLLIPGAHFVMILGDSAHAGVHVRVPEIAAELGALAGFESVEVRPLRARRSSSHKFTLTECAVILRNP